ncbi:hypothetical protein AB6D34_04840 [Pectobacterium brasiliense]|uniref:hypothetical protein n=1 Tax=Pectobacterium brasiliense TaxID=180957 RepID=UPI0019691F5F|nr:hypothetical protein [Pectobacterium brasiliense]MBN3250538.1 hypothetical protein [Pectobacterium brasiliense]MBN3258359.1 hypothetical protein [Pectobacterium brasiliense]
MDRREQELHSLAEQVMDSLKQLPQDGQERQITISVGGNNPGSIHVGSVVNINPAPQRPLELHEMDDSMLRKIRRELISKRNESKRRSYFNIPSLLFFVLTLSAFGFVFWNISLIYTGKSHWLDMSGNNFFIFIGWACLIMLTVRFMYKVRKIETRIVNENQNTIDTIDVIFRRRGI